jgi:hypothetical protein
VRRDFHIPNFDSVVDVFVRSCLTCHRNKSEHLHQGGLLMKHVHKFYNHVDLPWVKLSWDCITPLQTAGGEIV